MKPAVGLMPLFLIAFAGCRSASKTTRSSSEATFSSPAVTTDTRESATVAPVQETDAVFSAPIAAMRAGPAILVAGLVQSAGVVRVVALRDGRPLWSTNAIQGVAWTQNAELTIQPAGDGSALLWRFGLGTSGAGKLVLLGPRGEGRGVPTEIRASMCTTVDGFAWVDPLPQGGARVLARTWNEAAPRSVVVVPPDRTPTLACGDHVAFVLADGDENLTVTTFVPGDTAARAPDVAIRDADFSDDEREHRAFTVGDVLEIVRVGEQGAIATRDVDAGGRLTAWHKLKHGLSADDDIVAVDGNGMTMVMVFIRDAEDVCPSVGSLAQRVKALEVDRNAGAESVLELASADCAHTLGPFWIAPASSADGDSLVAWTERKRQVDSKATLISGVAYRRISGTGGQRPGRVDLDTDVLVEGGCDRGRCLGAALLRAPGHADAMLPMAIAVFSFP